MAEEESNDEPDAEVTTAITESYTITEELGDLDLITDNYIITDDSEAILVDGGYLGEMAGDISVTNGTGNTSGIETIAGGHVETISGDIYIDHDGASGSYAYGVNISGMITSNDTSSVGSITGEITIDGGVAYSYGVYLNGSTSTYKGGNTLGSIDTTIDINTTSGSAVGVKNMYGSIDTIAGKVIVDSSSGFVAGVDNYGYVKTLSATIDVEGASSGSVHGVYNRSIGDEGTIDLLTSTITATNVSGYCYGIKNIGDIGTISAEITAISTATSSASAVIAIYNLGCDISDGIKAIDGGTYSSISSGGSATTIWNNNWIGSIDATLISESESSWSSGIKNIDGNNTAKIESISGSITSVGATGSNGIYNKSIIGEVSASISSQADVYAYGIYNVSTGTLGTISSDITVYGATAESFGIVSFNTTDAVTFTGTITATSDSGMSIGIVSQSGSIVFGEGASVSASSTSGAAYALYCGELEDGSSDSSSLTLSSDSTTISLTGDISVAGGTGSLVFESGNYMISSTAWEVAEVVFSQGTAVTLTVASAEPEVASYSLVLKGDSASSDTTMVIQEGTTLTFEVSSVDALNGLDSALFIVDSSVDLSGIEAVSIILMDDGEAWSDGDTIDVSKLIAYSGSDSTEEDLAIAIFDDVTISVTDADFQTTTVLAASTDSEGDSGLVFTNPDIVPEPSTATLSLLALAALCARRRRK